MGEAEISPWRPGETESDPRVSDEAKPSPWDQASRSPRLGVGRGVAQLLGSDEAETSSSELDETLLGPWESDEAVVVSLTFR